MSTFPSVMPVSIAGPTIDFEHHIAFRKQVLAQCPDLDLPKYLLATEIRQLASLPTLNNTHRLLMLFCFNTGARINEALKVCPNDVLVHDHKVSIKLRTLKHQQRNTQGKPRKHATRLVPLYDKQFAAELNRYIVTHCSNRKNPIFGSPSDPTCAISDETARNWFKRIEAQAQAHGIELLISLTPKVMRHSYAIHLILNRVPLKVVQLHLGHHRQANTEIYTKVLSADLLSEHEIMF